MTQTSQAGPFFGTDGDALLVDSALLFVDVLGVRAMSRSPEADAHLLRLQQTVRRRFRDFLTDSTPWPARFFSDTLVLVTPIDDGDEDTATGELVQQAAWLQLNLIGEGFFLRGSLVLGRIHVGDILFGPALVEAYELESARAVHPRIVLSERTAQSQREALEAAGDPDFAPQRARLLEDDDGFTFVDYLGVLLEEPDDPRPALAAHRDAVMLGLTEHRAKRRQWEKYRWVAEYHNAVVAKAFPEHEELLIPRADATWQFSAFASARSG